MSHSSLRSILTPGTIAQAAIGWVAVLALALTGSLLEPPVDGVVLVIALAAIVAVIVIAAMGVVHQAEHLAERMGDPFGSLVLTLSIVLIEVVLISAVMLGPGEHRTIARDSVLAVMMIIMNLVIGLGLLLGGLRHGDLRVNRTGTSTYLGMIALFGVLAFLLPAVAGKGGSYTTGQEWPIVILTLAAYAFFLYRQTTAQAEDYQEVGAVAAEQTGSTPIGQVLREHRSEILLRTLVLVVTVVPIVLLSHDMATLLDDGLGRIGAPIALSGVLIAAIVFTPETLTAVRAALGGEMQRVVNLCHGAFVSTVGLTIPAVLLIGTFTGKTVTLAESPVNLVLMATTIILSMITFLSPRVTASHGAMHLVLFAVYGITLFSV